MSELTTLDLLLPFAVLLLPLAGFVVLALFGDWINKDKEQSGACWLACGTVLASFGFAVATCLRLYAVAGGKEGLRFTQPYLGFEWIEAASFRVPLNLLIDPLTCVMMLVVTGIGSLIHIYSVGYMAHDEERVRFFSYLNLFTFFMLLLVMGGSLPLLFVGWEGVGLCSYLLIGFWYKKDSASAAGLKAFVVNRIGDVGLILGMIFIFHAFGSLDLVDIVDNAGSLAPEAFGVFGPVTIACLLLFVGAIGKSAQIPLHVWLPDAMEGPTPVSALIHAATMVTAGVFLVARAYPLYLAVPWIMLVIAYVGAFTALLAATLALGESDIKRVLAYSTVSQLGYMMAALGAGALAAGVLHLLLHGFFKALLFLAAGAVIHAVHTNDMGAMGRLARAMPRTAVVFLVGTLALAGVPPFSGFVSKEAILGGVWEAGLRGPFVLLSVTVFLTAFYMFRAVFLTFFGARVAGGHPHDPPGVMMGPLWILALLSIVGAALGGAALGLTFPEFLRGTTGATLPHGPHWLTPFSVGLALAGVILAWLVYQRRTVSAEALTRGLGPLPAWAARGYGLDALYVALYRGAVLALARVVGWIDRYVVDGLVNAASAATLRAGMDLRRLQTGRAQDYLYGVTAGLLLMLVFWRLWA